jgi:hypothetical protein
MTHLLGRNKQILDARAVRCLLSIFGLLLAAIANLYADATVTFQNGVNGYAGSGDFSINTQYAQYNGGNGILWQGGSELGCYTTTGTGPYSAGGFAACGRTGFVGAGRSLAG